MSHLGVDPGKPAGWAAYYEDRVAESGVVSGDDALEIYQLLKEYAFLKSMVIEDQFIKLGKDHRGRTKVINPKGIKTLLHRRNIWDVLAELLHYEVHEVNPRTWQAYFKLKAGDKEGIQKLARINVNRVLRAHESDAALIAIQHAAQLHAAKILRGT